MEKKKIDITMNDDGTTTINMKGTFDEVGTMLSMGLDTLCEHHGVDSVDFTHYLARQLAKVAKLKRERRGEMM